VPLREPPLAPPEKTVERNDDDPVVRDVYYVEDGHPVDRPDERASTFFLRHPSWRLRITAATARGPPLKKSKRSSTPSPISVPSCSRRRPTS
jgi:hypothetical protein